MSKIMNLVKGMNTYYKHHAPFHNGCMGYSTNEAMEKLLGPIIEWFEDYIKNKDILEIACGTGNWTQVLARRARSVTATDINKTVIDIALEKKYYSDKVHFEIADAYNLESINTVFDAAFAADWWSHIPRSKIVEFVEGLHSKLRRGARVIFIDMMPRDVFNKSLFYIDEEGNRIYKRSLHDSREFEVVKNFPTEQELNGIFKNFADCIEYREHLELLRWMFTYVIKK